MAAAEAETATAWLLQVNLAEGTIKRPTRDVVRLEEGRQKAPVSRSCIGIGR